MVRPGYKETDAGIIPEDWDARLVGDNLEFKNGLNKAKAYFGHGTPIINYMDVFGNSGLQASDVAGLVSVTSEEQSAYSARKGDLFFTRTSETVDEIGMSAVLLEDLDNAVFSGFVLRGRDKPSASAIEIDFKKYCFRSSVVRKQIRSTASYTTRALTNGKLLSKVFVPTPSDPEEQKAIAEALSDVDGLIAGLEALIAKMRDLKTATMQQLLTGKTRLPGFRGEWTRVTIGTDIDLLTGFPFPSAKYTEGGIRLLRGSNIKREVLDWDPSLVQYWPSVSPALKKYLLAAGDVVIAMDGSLVGRSFGVMSENDLPALLLQRVARLRARNIVQRYLRHWVCSPFFTSHCDEVKTVTAIPHISPEDIRSFEIDLPPTKEEQSEIADVLDDLISEISALGEKLGKAKALKQGMMQELLTGRTRLI